LETDELKNIGHVTIYKTKASQSSSNIVSNAHLFEKEDNHDCPVKEADLIYQTMFG
jgi:hypothetical protein